MNDPGTTLLPQAAQNLIVLAREEAGAEKIFQSDGVRLLTQLLDTAKADLMLAALRTLAGLCSGHRARVGPAISWGIAAGVAAGCVRPGALLPSACAWLQPGGAAGAELSPARPEPPEVLLALTTP